MVFGKRPSQLLVAGYQAGFLWVAAVGIYLLLRRDIDGVQTGEVYVDQAEEYGMPPLTEDAATGVPRNCAARAGAAGRYAAAGHRKFARLSFQNRFELRKELAAAHDEIAAGLARGCKPLFVNMRTKSDHARAQNPHLTSTG